jgi:hypothetical protein
MIHVYDEANKDSDASLVNKKISQTDAVARTSNNTKLKLPPFVLVQTDHLELPKTSKQMRVIENSNRANKHEDSLFENSKTAREENSRNPTTFSTKDNSMSL